MKNGRAFGFLSLLLSIGAAWTGLAQDAKETPDSFRQATRSIDPFNRLASYPEDQRLREAIGLCVDRVAQLSSSELHRLNGAASDEISEKQRRHLYVAVSLIVDTVVTADVLRAEYHPALDASTVRKLDRMRSCIGTMRKIKGVPLEDLELNVSECLSLLKALARV